MRRTRRTDGFTLVEILIVLVIIGILAAIMLSVFSSARESARRPTCVSNIRQLGSALMMYAQDHDGYFIPEMTKGVNKWDTLIVKYLKSTDVFRCPSASVPTELSTNVAGFPPILSMGYALNFELYDERTRSRPAITDPSIRYPSTTVAFGEVSFTARGGGHSHPVTMSKPEEESDLTQGESYVGGRPGGLRHGGGSHYVFVDGHAKWYKPEQVEGYIGYMPDRRKPNDGIKPSFAID